MRTPLYALDSSVYIFRSYFALDSHWQSRDGLRTEAVYGFAAFLLRLLANESPVYLAAAFDESLGSGFRHRLYPAYKANRALPDDALAYQLAGCRRVAEVLGVPTYGCGEYEADDYLATMVSCAAAEQPVYVLSRDKDLAQLISDQVQLWDYGYAEPVDREIYLGQKAMEPALVPDYLALVGDSSDNIPGVPGIGARTATAILNTLGPVEGWLETPQLLDQVNIRGRYKLAEKCETYRDQIVLAKELVTLRADIPELTELSQLKRRGIDYANAEALFVEYGLQGLLKRLAPVACGAENLE